MDCDACEYLSSYFRSVNFMRSGDGCSEDEEVLFGLIKNISVSRKLMIFV